MPIYEYRCRCAHTFSVYTARMGAPSPSCPACGGAPRRLFSDLALSGRASPGPRGDQAPRSWESTNRGDPETIRHWQRTLNRRARLEERYPELAPDRRPVLAHEGPHAHTPLVARDEGGGGAGHRLEHPGPGGSHREPAAGTG